MMPKSGYRFSENIMLQESCSPAKQGVPFLIRTLEPKNEVAVGPRLSAAPSFGLLSTAL
jgi:hypothetical protein